MAEEIKVLIVEDEPLARDELIYLLEGTNVVQIVAECDSPEEAMTILNKEEVDVVFLDIQLENESGIQLAEKIQKLTVAPSIIFATAYDKYALDAFNVDAIDYILKPFEKTRVEQALAKIRKVKGEVGFRSPNRKLLKNAEVENVAVTTMERIQIIKVADILYVCAQNGKTIIKTVEGLHEITSTLVQLEQKLLNNRIIRVHRSYLINKDFVKEIEPWFNSTYNVYMQNGEKIPVSRNYAKELKQLFGF